MKSCSNSNCEQENPQPLTEFVKDKNRKDGLHPWCKSCLRRYREANRERRLPYLREWYKAHHQEMSAYREANREKRKQYLQQYYLANPDKVKERQCRYRRANPEIGAACERERLARKTINGGSHTSDEWLALCEQYDNRCLACGKQKPLTVDHVVPISKGGSNDIANIQPLCKSCNSAKGTKIIDYRPK